MNIEELIDYLEKNLFKDVDLNTLSKELGVTKSYLIRCFKSSLGLTPMDYLKKRRLGLAATDIVNTDYNITDIAMDYTYNSPEAFTRAFKNQHKISPREFRVRGKTPVFFTADFKGSEGYKVMAREFNPIPEIVDFPGKKISGEYRKTSINRAEATGTGSRVVTCVFIDISSHQTLEHEDEYTIFIESENGNEELSIRGGKCALFSFKNPGNWLLEAYRYIYTVWLPSSGYSLDRRENFIIATREGGDLYIPVK